MANFISWNSRGYINKRDEVRDLISDHWPICFTMQETHLKDNDKVTIHGYSTLEKTPIPPQEPQVVWLSLFLMFFPHDPIWLNTNI